MPHMSCRLLLKAIFITSVAPTKALAEFYTAPKASPISAVA